MIGYLGPKDQWEVELEKVSRSGLIESLSHLLHTFGFTREASLAVAKAARKDGKWLDAINRNDRFLRNPDKAVDEFIRRRDGAKSCKSAQARSEVERKESMSIYLEIANEVGELVAEKNAAYGSSFAKAGDFLKLLFPSGISADRYDDALLLVRIFDKQMRIATDRDALGESPYQDIAGYGILGVSLHHERNECASQPSTPVASAPAPNAHGILADTPSFVLRNARAETTAIASEPNGPNSSSSSSQKPASSLPSSGHTDATVQSATASALNDVAAPKNDDDAYLVRFEDLLWRHNVMHCSVCNIEIESGWIHIPIETHYSIELRCCSALCARNLLLLVSLDEIDFRRGKL